MSKTAGEISEAGGGQIEYDDEDPIVRTMFAEAFAKNGLESRMASFYNQVISNTGFESPCSTKVESRRFSPLETPSALCPPQEAGFTLNK